MSSLRSIESVVDYGAAKAIGERPHVGEPDALATLVLRTGAPEQLEDALMVIGHRCRGRCPRSRRWRACPSRWPRTTISRGRSGSQIFDRIVDAGSEDLLDRQPVVMEVGQSGPAPRAWPTALPSASLRLATMSSITRRISSRSGDRTRRPWRDRFRIALISRSIFWVDERMNPIASGRSSRAYWRFAR